MADGKQEVDLIGLFSDLSWKIIEAKILYYQPDTSWDKSFIEQKMLTDAQYDEIEKQYLTTCRELGEENDLVHKSYPGFEDVPGDGMMEVDWDDLDVKEVYEALCEEYREWSRKKLKDEGTLKKRKKTPTGPRPSRKDWEVWEGYAYPENNVWRAHYQFLAYDYHHAMTVLQIISECRLVQVFTPSITSNESRQIKKVLKIEPFIVLEEKRVSNENLRED